MGRRSENLGCLGVLLGIFGDREKRLDAAFPYRVRDDFLSEGEIAFYRALVRAAGSDLAVFAKVRLADVLFAMTFENRWAANNKIQSKHVDFVLCNPNTFKIAAVVELDDKSHARADRIKRDEFVDNAFKAAGLPLIRVRAQSGYDVQAIRAHLEPLLGVTQAVNTPTSNMSATQINESAPPAPIAPTPNCPKCGVPMALRTARRGATMGEQFWGCTNYPRCREMLKA